MKNVLTPAPRRAVDIDIRGLVARFNTHGLRTYASCQGHGWPADRLLPYVAFTAPLAEARKLARALREDAESPEPALRWGWEVTAGFNSAFMLCYRLGPTAPHRWYDRYRHHALRQDFAGIVRLLKPSSGNP